MQQRRYLRPLERRVLDLTAAGNEHHDIAVRFRRSPGFIRRVHEWTDLPGREMPGGTVRGALRPLERRVVRWRDQGEPYAAIASRFRRTPGFIERVERLARQKMG